MSSHNGHQDLFFSLREHEDSSREAESLRGDTQQCEVWVSVLVAKADLQHTQDCSSKQHDIILQASTQTYL